MSGGLARRPRGAPPRPGDKKERRKFPPIFGADWLACLAQAWAAAPGETPNEILIGQDVDTSGAIAVRMKTMVQAADAPTSTRSTRRAACLGGRSASCAPTSANKPDKTKENVKKLVETDGVFAMWGISGTGNVAVALPYLEERKVPLIGSTSGADPFYAKPHSMLFNLKAGYGDEIRRITAHLKDTPTRPRIAFVYLDNGFGREALKTAQAAAKDNNLEVLGVAAFKEDGSDIAQAVKPLAKLNAPRRAAAPPWPGPRRRWWRNT